MSDLDLHISNEPSREILSLSFLDDVGWIASGNTIQEVAETLERCAQGCIQWGTNNAVNFEPDKSEAILLTRKRRIDEGTTINVGGHKISLGRKPVRWLGVYLDSELRLNHHHSTWLQKAKRRQQEISRLCRKRGLPAFSVANLQRAVVQSVATYGIELSAVGPEKLAVPAHRVRSLQVLINEQARRTLGAFKTTPEGFLMAESLHEACRSHNCETATCISSASACSSNPEEANRASFTPVMYRGFTTGKPSRRGPQQARA